MFLREIGGRKAGPYHDAGSKWRSTYLGKGIESESVLPLQIVRKQARVRRRLRFLQGRES